MLLKRHKSAIVVTLLAVAMLPTEPAFARNRNAPITTGKTRSAHAPYSMKMCKFCHVGKDPSKPGAAKKPVNKACFSCHNELQEGLRSYRYHHAPIKKKCTSCHNPHNSRQRNLLTSSLSGLCASCHKPILKKMRAKVRHGAMTQGRACGSCHEPHGSNLRHLLKRLPYYLCVRCHGRDGVKDNEGRRLTNFKTLLRSNPYRHAPVRQKNCASCHETHGSANFRLLTQRYPERFYAKYARSAYALCYACHERTNIESASTYATGFRDGTRNLHYVHVVRPSRGRSCRACHEVHAGPQPFQIRNTVPYGSSGWKLKLHFTKTAGGGSCEKTCHDKMSYARKKL